MNKNLLALFAALTLSLGSIYGEENKLKSFEETFPGKPVITLFDNFKQGLGSQSSETKFEHHRGYLGFKFDNNGPWSGQVVFDIYAADENARERLEFDGELKTAYLTWTKNKWEISGGVIKTLNYALKESDWGYRYILRSYEDEYGISPSADIGFSVAHAFSDKLSADFQFTNGKGFRDYDVTDNFRYGLGLTYRPSENITLRGYYDLYSRDKEIVGGKDQLSYSLYGAYEKANWIVGTEYSRQANSEFVDDHILQGISTFATYRACKRINIFARYDWFDSSDTSSIQSERLTRFGFDYTPWKFLKISPNFELREFIGGGEGHNENFFFVNFQIKY